MTAGSYADAAGLVERSAAAYAAAVPVTPAGRRLLRARERGLAGQRDLAAPVAGLRSLLIQALHPLAMAGVDQHSDWRADPVGRLAATSAYEVTVTFGDRAGATRAAQRVRAVHEHVRGVDPVTGQAVRGRRSGAAAVGARRPGGFGPGRERLFGTPLTAADADRYVAEMTIAAELLGVPHEMVPDSVAALDRYFTGGPGGPAPHARGRGVDELPARPARTWTRTSPSCGRTSGTPRCWRCPAGPSRCTATPSRRR